MSYQYPAYQPDAFQQLLQALGAFQAGGAFNPGFQSIEAETQITEIPSPSPNPPVDFVISAPYYMHQIQVYRKVLAVGESDRQDETELQEMMQLYAAARKNMRIGI